MSGEKLPKLVSVTAQLCGIPDGVIFDVALDLTAT